jgi:hypothetical protein
MGMPTTAPAMNTGLNAIMSAVDRIKMSIEVQKLIGSIQSGCTTFERLVQKKDFDTAADIWKFVRTLGLEEIENRINDADANTTLAAFKELQQVVKYGAEVAKQLKENNQGEMQKVFQQVMTNLTSASIACRDWNERELTKIRSITYQLLNP